MDARTWLGQWRQFARRRGAARRAVPFITLCLAALCGVAAQAATFAVDDSASQVEGPVSMRWRADFGAARDSAAVDGATRVHIVLNLAPWVGKRGRIFMTLPPQPVSSLQVQWRARGPLRGGTLRGGERVLVYEGPIESAQLHDWLDVTVNADGRELATPQRLQFAFEIDLP